MSFAESCSQLWRDRQTHSPCQTSSLFRRHALAPGLTRPDKQDRRLPCRSFKSLPYSKAVGHSVQPGPPNYCGGWAFESPENPLDRQSTSLESQHEGQIIRECHCILVFQRGCMNTGWLHRLAPRSMFSLVPKRTPSGALFQLGVSGNMSALHPERGSISKVGPMPKLRGLPNKEWIEAIHACERFHGPSEDSESVEGGAGQRFPSQF
jgi:hypothetical protein